MEWYNSLQILADSEHYDTQAVQVIEARNQLSVLRTIMAGGLMTPEGSARHKRLSSDQMCRCGIEKETVEHVSWRCPQYETLRNELAAVIPSGLEQLPTCVRYAGIIPVSSHLSTRQIRALQSFLVQVWRHHIKQWHSGEDLVVPSSQPSTGTQVLRGDTIKENGHLLAARETGPGVWCKRCGKYVSLLKHVRLKITKFPCKHPGGVELQSEGHNTSVSRLDQLEREMNLKYNNGGHVLKWNRKLGKQINSENEGWIECLRCKRWWRWKGRVYNMARTTCLGNRTTRPMRRVATKTPMSHIEFVANDELPSSSGSRQNVFDQVGVG